MLRQPARRDGDVSLHCLLSLAAVCGRAQASATAAVSGAPLTPAPLSVRPRSGLRRRRCERRTASCRRSPLGAWHLRVARAGGCVHTSTDEWRRLGRVGVAQLAAGHGVPDSPRLVWADACVGRRVRGRRGAGWHAPNQVRFLTLSLNMVNAERLDRCHSRSKAKSHDTGFQRSRGWVLADMRHLFVLLYDHPTTIHNIGSYSCR